MDNFEDKVKKALDEIRPALQEDGGDLELIEIKEKEVKVELQGACHGCPMARLTLKDGVESYLRESVDPEITVIADGLPDLE